MVLLFGAMLTCQGYEPQIMTNFINRPVFCMFAEGVGLLPNRMFTPILRYGAYLPRHVGGRDARSVPRNAGREAAIGLEDVEWFNR